MMLDFYGFTLDQATGAVARSAAHAPRFRNLLAHSHNNLRITRILKALGEYGLERYKVRISRLGLTLSPSNDLGRLSTHCSNPPPPHTHTHTTPICIELTAGQAPLLVALLHEIVVTGALRGLADSCVNYWVPTLRDDQARAALLRGLARFCFQ
jgi:hypothetical protein